MDCVHTLGQVQQYILKIKEKTGAMPQGIQTSKIFTDSSQ